MDFVRILQDGLCMTLSWTLSKVLPSSIEMYLAPCGLLAVLETAPEGALRDFESGQFSSATSFL